MGNARPTLRIGMVGQGFMGKAHSNAFRQAGRFFDLPFRLECKALCGRDTNRLGQMADAWGWQETCTDWRSLIARDDIDIIDIAVPNSLHAEIAIEAGRSGKTVLCEKPLAVSGEEASRMMDAVRHVPNMVWFNYRRVPAISFAKRLIDEGRVGKVFHYRACYLQQWGIDPSRVTGWKLDRSQAGSGVSGDLLSHVLDTALWLNGPIRELTAANHTFVPGREVEDASLVLAKFENGSIGTFEATRFAVGCRNKQTFEIHGDKGMIRFDLENLNHLDFLDATEAPNLQGARTIQVNGPDHPYSENFWRPGHPIGYEHTFIATIADFTKALAGESAFHPNFEDAKMVQFALDAVDASAKEGGWKALVR